MLNTWWFIHPTSNTPVKPLEKKRGPLCKDPESKKEHDRDKDRPLRNETSLQIQKANSEVNSDDSYGMKVENRVKMWILPRYVPPWVSSHPHLFHLCSYNAEDDLGDTSEQVIIYWIIKKRNGCRKIEWQRGTVVGRGRTFSCLICVLCISFPVDVRVFGDKCWEVITEKEMSCAGLVMRGETQTDPHITKYTDWVLLFTC